jgi:hypothetical protein
MMKVIKIVIAVSLLLLIGGIGMLFVALANREKELNRIRTEPARQARLAKLKEDEKEPVNDNPETI